MTRIPPPAPTPEGISRATIRDRADRRLHMMNRMAAAFVHNHGYPPGTKDVRDIAASADIIMAENDRLMQLEAVAAELSRKPPSESPPAGVTTRKRTGSWWSR